MLPERIEALQLMARALTLHGRTDEAAAYQRTLAQQLPEYSANKTLIERSIQLIEDGRLHEASEVLKQVLENGGDSFAGTLLGIVSYMQGDVSQAAALLMAHIDPETANSSALELLLSAKFQLNEIDQVLEILEPELQTRRDNATLLGLFGLAKLARQDLAGISFIEKSLQIDPNNNRLRLAMLTFYQRQGLLPQALEQARLAYETDPLDPAVQEALVQLLLGSNKIEETLTLAQEIARASPDESHAQTLAGLACLMAGSPDDARKHLQRAIKISPNDASAWMAMARLAYSEGAYRSAEDYFSRVLDIVPDSIDALKGSISSTEAQGDVDRGLQKLQTLSEKRPQSGMALSIMAQYRLRNQQAEAAATLIEEAIQRQPGQAYIEGVALEVYRHLTEASLVTNDFTLARKQLTRGLAQLPNARPLLQLLAEIEMRDGNPVAAHEAAELLLQIAPASGYELLGDIYSESDPGAALNAYFDAWNIQVSSPLANKIFRLLKATDPERADTFTKDWSTQLPGDTALVLVKAIEAQNASDPTTAIALYQQLLEAEPDNVTALNNLAWLYLDAGDKAARALELAQMAEQLSPDNSAVLDTLGMAYLARGDVEQGIHWLDRALQLEPGSTVIQGHLEQARNR
jgi:tetratricopeptide (TPR) repeat protein